MEKSNIEKAKELFIYAPLGAAGFVKDNAPTFFSMFVSRGKRDAGKTNFKPGENINLNEAQARGEEIAQNVVVGATKVIDFVENSVRSFHAIEKHYAQLSAGMSFSFPSLSFSFVFSFCWCCRYEFAQLAGTSVSSEQRRFATPSKTPRFF